MKIRTPILRPKGATGGLPASVFARRAHDGCQGLQSLVAIFPFLPRREADESDFRFGYSCLGRRGSHYILDDQPVAKHHVPFRVRGDFRFVRDEQDGDALIAIELLEKRHDFFARFRVQVSRGLISQEHGRPRHQGPGDGDALLLSAGELVRLMAEPIGKAQSLQ